MGKVETGVKIVLVLVAVKEGRLVFFRLFTEGDTGATNKLYNAINKNKHIDYVRREIGMYSDISLLS